MARLHHNPRATRGEAAPPVGDAAPATGRPGEAAPPAADGPLRFHRTLPGYAPTPLVDAPAAAAALGVARVLVKDESARLGMPSFKILGASWATYRALARDGETLDNLRARLGGRLELVAATDGNHGRAVARMATLLGLSAHILVPHDMVGARREAIAGEGARVTVVEGGYDDAVAASAALADADHVVISDTSWPGYEQVPAWVIEGYATIGAELDAQLAAPPDVVAAQAGVGAFAAALTAHFRPQGATIVAVEPDHAACVIASAEAGRIVTVP
ncbi:MAG TPA: pyridoxal-phosphate dependent enzyme, partial [Solirubrobacter sp.]|nr:pyridoxal-phosphate dependent enzyme [Solirubrobacter sp.]